MKEKYFYNMDDINIDDFQALCTKKTDLHDYENSDHIEKNIVIYNGDKLRENINKKNIKNEFHHCLLKGPGAFVIKKFFHEIWIIDNNTTVLKAIIKDEKQDNLLKGDHFGSPDTHDRVWNAFEKICTNSPYDFINYYSNPLFSLVFEAWLGPDYQITSQVNVIKPKGKAQMAHRDYHFGFQSDQKTTQFPTSLQAASQFLTLQGAIAHTDMPVESGPTLLLPFSQLYDLGYTAFRNKKFINYFNRNAIQIPLDKGDAIFFNPALFHAGGENRTQTFERIANLIQTSVTFGKPMETINRKKMIRQLYPILIKNAKKDISSQEINSLVAAVSDGYPFPTNLDKTPPVNGNAPESMHQLTLKALQEEWDTEFFYYKLHELEEARS